MNDNDQATNGQSNQNKSKKRIGVIICGRVWLNVQQKIQDWIRNHPDEKVVDRIPIVFCMESGRYCGGLMVETDQEYLESDF